MIRPPVVAGQFYPARREALEAELRDYTEPGLEKEKAIGILCPHAGFMYSGAVAGAVYSRIEIPRQVVLIGPNHTGYGPAFSIMAEGEWPVPNAKFEIDVLLADRIASEIPLLERDQSAHMFEHSLEVQLPFIAWFSQDVKIVPIVIMNAKLGELEEAGKGLARAIKSSVKGVLMVASSDMSHYIPDGLAREKDGLAIERILALDPDGLYSVIHAERITMCGYMPAVMMLFAARELGAREARLVKYATSAEVSGDFLQVVGYAGIIIK